MIRLLASIFILFLCCSCTGMSLAAKADSYQTEMTMHKLRADIEEMKHDLHTNKMEISIVEGKIINNEDTVTALKRDTLENYLTKLEKNANQLGHIEKKLVQLEAKYEKVQASLSSLLSSTDESRKALTQSKEKFQEIENTLSLHFDTISEIKLIKQNIEQITTLIDAPAPHFSLDHHRVKSGETLEQIAKKHNITVEKLKLLNHIDNEPLTPGKALLIPLEETP